MSLTLRPIRIRKCFVLVTIVSTVFAAAILKAGITTFHVHEQKQQGLRESYVPYIQIKSKLHNSVESYSVASRTSKWIVTSSIETDTLINIQGWTVLLYGNKINSYCRLPECVRLDDQLSKDNFQETSTGKLSDKLSGYLYAISQGATHICVVNVWVAGLEELITGLVFSDKTAGIVPFTNGSAVSPQNLFTIDNDIDLGNSNSDYFKFAVLNDLIPSIQLPLCIHHKCTYAESGSLPPVYLPVGTVTSLAGNVIVFSYDAFWALPMLNFGPFSSHLIQKVLWLAGGSVGIYPVSKIMLQRERTDVRFSPKINQWFCDEKYNVNDCITNLIEYSTRHGLVKETNNSSLLILKYLTKTGYTFPERKEMRELPNEQTFGLFKKLPVRHSKNSSAVKILKFVCPDIKLNFSVTPIYDIGLIITFNVVKLYRNIPMLEVMYRPYFKHIIYCGPNLTSFTEHVQTFSIRHFLFIEAFKRQWYYMHECTAEAMKLNLGVAGFLQIGDDTIVNPWNIRDLPRESFWLHTGLRVLAVTAEVRWAFWVTGRRMLLDLLEEMRSGDIRNDENVKQFLKNYRSNSADFKNMFVATCDFIYTPLRFKNEFIYLADLFKSRKVMLEIGYPSIVMGLQERKDIHFLPNGNLIFPNRTKWPSFYNTEIMFMHPFKLGRMMKNKNGRRVLCDMYFRHKS